MCQVAVPGRRRPHGARQTADSRRLPHRPRVGTPPAERRLLVPGVPCETVISGGLWSQAHGRACPADRASFPGAPALCPEESRLSGRVGPPLLHPGSEDSHMLCLPAGLQACQLALSARTVWARCPNGDLARRYGVTDKNPAGDYWKKIPGNVTCVTGRCWVPGHRGWCRGPLRGLLPLGWFSQTRPIPASRLRGAQHLDSARVSQEDGPQARPLEGQGGRGAG